MNMYYVWTDRAIINDYPYGYEEVSWGEYVFAKTPGQAKMQFLKGIEAEIEAYTDLRAQRVARGISRDNPGIVDPAEDAYHPHYQTIKLLDEGAVGWPLFHVIVQVFSDGTRYYEVEFGDTQHPIIVSFNSYSEAGAYCDGLNLMVEQL